MDFMKLYNEWLESATEDADLIAELESIKGNEDEIYDRFYKALTFGTAGLRGVIGAGTNRMNIYVVRQATQGLANYIIQKYGKGSVAISHDSRIKADLFMLEAARVLAGNGIKVYITSELQPTPVLSYLVRYFKCQAGIMVTASHNPAKYNGYKAYGEDGCQMTDVAAGIVYDEICKLDMFKDVKIADLDEAVKSGLIEYVSDDVYDSYLEKVMEQQVNPGICEGAGLKVVYTPLNGTGNKLVRKVLKKIGVEEITVVPEQELPDGNFTTCPYPNPEIKEALQKGIELCEKVQPDLLLATDPDADRVVLRLRITTVATALFQVMKTALCLQTIFFLHARQTAHFPKSLFWLRQLLQQSLSTSFVKSTAVNLKMFLQVLSTSVKLSSTLKRKAKRTDMCSALKRATATLQVLMFVIRTQ